MSTPDVKYPVYDLRFEIKASSSLGATFSVLYCVGSGFPTAPLTRGALGVIIISLVCLFGHCDMIRGFDTSCAKKNCMSIIS